MSRYNLREQRGKVRALLGPGAEIIESLEIDNALYEAYCRLCKEFGILKSSWTAAAVSGARFYKPPADMIELERVDFNYKKISYISPDDIWNLGDDDIDLQTPTWTEDT